MSGRAPKTSSYHHGDLRRSLLDEAVKVVRQSGPQAVSLRELARRLGVTSGAPHHHFAGKDDLFAAIATEGFAELMRLGQERVLGAGDVDPRERLGIAARSYLEFATTERARYAVMFLPQLRDRRRFADLHETGGRALELLAGGFVAAGTPEAEAFARAAACWATLHGFAVLANDGFLDSSVYPLEQLRHEIVATATGARLGPRPP